MTFEKVLPSLESVAKSDIFCSSISSGAIEISIDLFCACMFFFYGKKFMGNGRRKSKLVTRRNTKSGN